MNRMISIAEGMEIFDRVTRELKPEEPKSYKKVRGVGQGARRGDKVVSVLIPTLNRYSYLEKALEGLRLQTIKPLEIIIVDQSRKEFRSPKFYDTFSDLPLRVIYQDEPGQCSSRNAGLRVSAGDFILFLDDDDEVQSDLIEKHLNNIDFYQCEVSSGVADEVGAGALPENFTFVRQSDVFPTNNTMIKKEILKKTGLFDLAYNRKQRADGDLGMRVYLSGAQMILDPEISVLHHHAPEGGLRFHHARKVTYAASRQNLWTQHLPSDSEIYLGFRYFTKQQVREFLWHKIAGIFSIDGDILKCVIKRTIGVITLPLNLLKIGKYYRSAERMFKQFPKIEFIEGREA